MIVFLDGKFVNAAKAKVSIFDHGFLYGDGVYETLRTYGGKVWQIQEHVRRLRSSAEKIGISLPWNLDHIAFWINETVRKNRYKESRIRVTLTRGQNGFDFADAKKPTLLIVVQELVPQPTDVYERGVFIVTFPMERQLPEAKALSLLPMVLGQRYMAQKKAYEAVFVAERSGGNFAKNGAKVRLKDRKQITKDDWWVREGTVTNVFIVRHGVLMTPKTGVLAGTTRDFILKLAKKLKLKAVLQDFTLQQLYDADEVFITNAPRGIIPVIKVDRKKIGDGKPGSFTQLLQKIFEKEVQRI